MRKRQVYSFFRRFIRSQYRLHTHKIATSLIEIHKLRHNQLFLDCSPYASGPPATYVLPRRQDDTSLFLNARINIISVAVKFFSAPPRMIVRHGFDRLMDQINLMTITSSLIASRYRDVCWCCHSEVTCVHQLFAALLSLGFLQWHQSRTKFPLSASSCDICMEGRTALNFSLISNCIQHVWELFHFVTMQCQSHPGYNLKPVIETQPQIAIYFSKPEQFTSISQPLGYF